MIRHLIFRIDKDDSIREKRLYKELDYRQAMLFANFYDFGIGIFANILKGEAAKTSLAHFVVFMYRFQVLNLQKNLCLPPIIRGIY